MICFKYLHLVCGNVTEDCFSNFSDGKMLESGFIWRCGACAENLELKPQSNDILNQLNELKNTFNKRIGKLEKLIITKADNQQKDINTYTKEIEGITGKVQTNETTKASKSIDKRITNMSTTIADLNDSEAEAIQKKKKVNNVCIFNIPVSSDDEPEKEYIHDTEIVAQAIGQKEEIKKDIADIFRKGERQPEKTRPVIVNFSSPEARQ